MEIVHNRYKILIRVNKNIISELTIQTEISFVTVTKNVCLYSNIKI